MDSGFMNVAVDRKTAEMLEQLADQYQERHPNRARPGKTGIIRVLVTAAARNGITIDEVGPLPGHHDLYIPGPGRSEFRKL